RDRHKGHDIRTEFSGAGVEVPHIQLVGSEIDAEHVIAIKISEDLVRVRPFLAVRIGSGSVADALEIVGHVADRTVGIDSKDLKIAAGVTGGEQILPRGLHAEMGGILPVRWFYVDEC